MAQLPPKVPIMTPNWPDFSHKKMPPMGLPPPNGGAAAAQNPSWVDEFLDFSSARRGSHRRSVSDSIAFLEAPIMAGPENMGEFERFDDEQFMSMFTYDVSKASSPSDHNSINEKEEAAPLDDDDDDQKERQVKNENDEVESSCKLETQILPNGEMGSSNDRINVDPKRVKRILANRQSAQRSRVKKLQYISELEHSVTSLQAEVSVLSPRVAFLDHQRLLLNVDNSALKQRIAALAQDKIFKDAHQEALKREIERLRQVYHQQNLNNMDNTAPLTPPPSAIMASADQELLNA